MISIKTPHEIEIMRKAGKITAEARAVAGDMIRPGVTTHAIDKAVHDYIVSQGATPSFLGYGGFPASACISINDVVIHGIPGKQVIQEGDIVSVDVGAYWGGFHGDCAATFICGETDEVSRKLVEVTRQSFYEGLKFCKKGSGFRISPMRFRPAWKPTALVWCGSLLVTVWASSSTRSLRFPTMGTPAADRD